MKSVPLRILLIEDSPTDAALVDALLQQVDDFSFAMDNATTLENGIDKLAESTYDAVILDLGLPDSLGVSSYERVRSQEPRIPVIIATGNDDRTVLAEAMKQGADNYLIKDTLDGNRIAIAILSAIRNRSLQA